MIARVTAVTVIWRQLLPDWESEINELVDLHVFGVYVYIIMFLVLMYIFCWCRGMNVFDFRLLY